MYGQWTVFCQNMSHQTFFTCLKLKPLDFNISVFVLVLPVSDMYLANSHFSPELSER